MTATEALARDLEVAGLRPVTDDTTLRTAARDFAWLSPILTKRLGERLADIVVFPETTDALIESVALAVAREVSITTRGRGTGNYGQSVPLEGGLVIDTTRCSRVVRFDGETVTVEPGVVCQRVELDGAAHGLELTMFPSTTQSTIGGFVSGGAGGSGSIEHGFVWDGFVESVDVVMPSDPSTAVSISAASTAGGSLALRPFLHTYGTLGVLARLTVRCEPKRAWIGLAASFPTMADALRATRSLLDSGAELRLLGASEAALVRCLPSTPWLDPERASVRAVVELASSSGAAALLVAEGGRVDVEGPAAIAAITRFSYNHVTLHAKRADPSICHIQLGGLEFPEHAALLAECMPDARLHVDAMRGPKGKELGGLLISRFESEETLQAGIDRLRGAGVWVTDPHTWEVTDPDGALASLARVTDPLGLLNPGKLIRTRSGGASVR